MPNHIGKTVWTGCASLDLRTGSAAVSFITFPPQAGNKNKATRSNESEEFLDRTGSGPAVERVLMGDHLCLGTAGLEHRAG